MKKVKKSNGSTRKSKPKREEVPMTNEEQVSICRVCLGTFTESCRSIWEPHREGTIVQYMASIANIKAHEDDDLPSSICEPCLQELDGAVDWKLKCEHSDCYLQQTAAQLEDEKPPLGDVKSEPECAWDGASNAGDDWAPPADPPSDEEVSVKCESPAQRPAPRAAQPQQVQCHDCGELFRTKCKLRVHWKKAHRPKEYVCPKCKRCIKSLVAYKKHVNAKKPCLDQEMDITIEGTGNARIFKCNKCTYTGQSRTYIREHCKSHSESKVYACNLCPDVRYSHLSSLSRHNFCYHSDRMRDGITCHKCGKQVNVTKWSSHMKTHKEAKYQCDICQKLLKTKTALVGHLNTHAPVRPYKCDICGKLFATKGNMNAHKQKHNQERCLKKYSCTICGYKTLTEAAINDHQRRHGSTNCACSQCGIFFPNTLKLTVHMKLHSDGKDYSCPVCHRSFQILPSVYRHLTMKHQDILSQSNEPCLLKTEEQEV